MTVLKIFIHWREGIPFNAIRHLEWKTQQKMTESDRDSGFGWLAPAGRGWNYIILGASIQLICLDPLVAQFSSSLLFLQWYANLTSTLLCQSVVFDIFQTSKLLRDSLTAYFFKVYSIQLVIQKASVWRLSHHCHLFPVPLLIACGFPQGHSKCQAEHSCIFSTVMNNESLII